MTAALAHSNLISALATTVSGTGWDAAYPVTEVQSRYLFKRAKTTGNSATIVIDLGSALPVAFLALCHHTLAADSTVRVQGGAFDTGVVTIYPGQDYALPFAEETAQTWTITIINSAPFEIGRVFIGQTFQPDANFSYGYSDGLETTSTAVQALGGQEFFDIRAVRRVWSGTFEWLTFAEADAFKAIMRQSDISSEVYFMQDASATTGRGETWWLARFQELSAVAHPYPTVKSVPMQLAELL
jgi:hypothetical protein